MESLIISTSLEAILENFIHAIPSQIRLLRDVDDEIEKLRNTISATQSQLLDGDAAEDNNHATTGISFIHWVQKLKHTFNDAHDMLDLISTEALQRNRDVKKLTQKVCVFFSSSNQLSFRLKMGRKVNAIMEKLNCVASERSMFYVEECPVVMRSGERMREEKVFGRENDQNVLIEDLLDSNKTLSVISIVGIGGVGKTLLAELVYSDEDVESNFDLRVWLCFSAVELNVFDVKLILKKMVECITRISLANPSMDRLRSLVRDKVGGKRFLLVLDGVRNEDQEEWLSLKKELMVGEMGNYMIDKMTLIKLWMAQGLIHSPKGNQHIEDVGDEYFMQLLWISFFQDIKKDERDNILSCRMHDLIHDLAVFVAGTGSTITDAKAGNIDGMTRHISFYSSLPSLWKLPDQLLRAKKLRTFLLPAQYKGKLDKSSIDKLISSFRCLRVLDLHDSGIEIVPPSIGNLLLLRYLDLSGNKDIRLLPTSITRLLHLQTLKLSSCVNLRELPRDIWKLVELRHLEISGCKSLAHMPYGLGQLTSLQTLPLFVIGKGIASSGKSGGLSELIGLNNLRGELTILNLGHEKIETSESNAANLEGKGDLQAVRLQWEQIKADDDQVVADDDPVVTNDEALFESLRPHPNVNVLSLKGYMGLKFPSWMKDDLFWCLPNLVAIDMSRCSKCQHLPSLGQLRCLKTLYLGELSALEYIDNGDHEPSKGNLVGCGRQSEPPSTVPFSCLKELTLYKLPKLMGWWKRREGVAAKHQQLPLLPSFPCLSKLSIEHCPNLASMPFFLNLEEELKLTNVSGELIQQQSMMVKQTTATASASSAASSFSASSSYCSSFSSSFSSSSSLFPSFSTNSQLSKLKSLHIASIKDLDCLPEGWPRNLTALDHLSIGDCGNLVLSNNDGIQWQSLRSLRSLVLVSISKLVYLPEWIQNVTTLQHLQIVNCPELMTLPEWMSNLISLQEIEIKQCPNLISLPSLVSLRKLKISDCPILLERCQEDTGVDWPNMGQGRVKAGACLNLLALHLSNCSLAVTDFGSTFLMEDQILQNLTSLPEGIYDPVPRISGCPNAWKDARRTGQVGALNLIAYEGSAAPQSRVLRDQCILQMALTLDAIWNHRNQVALNERRTNLIRVISNLEQRENEYLSFMHQTTEQVLLGNVHWSCPPTDKEKFKNIVVEGDSKVCFKLLNSDSTAYWTIRNVLLL
uniref:Rx N-terminal domain-containing protein n=1 Tax=Fagus sylvatica TaxID=28930 RepID=A0A2N9H4X3_FAGSY